MALGAMIATELAGTRPATPPASASAIETADGCESGACEA